MSSGGRRGAEGNDGRVLGCGADRVHYARRRPPDFDLPDDEIELGVGIHGEPGRARAPMAPAAEIADVLLARSTTTCPCRATP